MNPALTMTAVALTLYGATGAGAQTPQRIQQFTDWGSYRFNENGTRNCFVLSTPKTMRPAAVDHGDIFFLVSRKPEAPLAFEAEAVMGYPLREGSEVTVDVDGETFRMFTRGENAWMLNLSREPKLVEALRAGREMEIDAVSQRGTKTRYTYSLAGVTAALKSIAACR